LVFHSGCEADHSPPSSAEVKEWVELYLHSPNAPSWRGAQLGEHRDNLISRIFKFKGCQYTVPFYIARRVVLYVCVCLLL
jgi:hypothetical protein